MTRREARRIKREWTEEERLRWEAAVDETMRERPQLVEQGRQLHAAALENTLSGRLRQGVHASAMTLQEIAGALSISEDELAQFLTGERPLPSDVLDRLSQLLGYELVRSA